MAIVSGVNSGLAVLHAKSLRPLITTEDLTEAITGSLDVIRSENAAEVILGVKSISLTIPAEIERELSPTGTNTPSADKTSAVRFASTSPGTNKRRTCGAAADLFGFLLF